MHKPTKSTLCVAALLLTTIVFATSLAIAAVLAAVAGASDPWDLPVGPMGQFYLGSLISTFKGVGFGLLLLNTPAAIVTFLLAPLVVSSITGLVPSLHVAGPWVDFSSAVGPLYDDIPGMLTGEQWSHLISATFVWFVLPFAVGIWRVLTAEVK